MAKILISSIFMCIFTLNLYSKTYYVSLQGNNKNIGNKQKPFKSIQFALNKMSAGDTLYIHDVATGSPTEKRAIYNNAGFLADKTNQFVYASYPNTRPTVTGGDGVWMYHTKGIVTSKLAVYSSNCDAVAEIT